MGKFKGTTALITGASSGIGKAIASELASKGAHLVVVARRKDRLEALKVDIETRYGVRVDTLVMDLSLPGSAEQLFEAVSKLNSTIDILVNNAGSGKKCKFYKEQLSCYQSMIHLNVSTMTELTYLFGQEMVQRGDGYILQVASVAGFMPVPNFSVYAATKSFVLSFGRAVHNEFAAKNVHVTTICPGVTETEFLSRAEVRLNKILNTIKMTKEEVARQAVDALLRHRAVVIPGTANKLMISGLNCVPRKVHGKLAQIAMN